MKRINITIAAIALAFGLYSCTKDNNIFEDSPSARLQGRLKETKEALVAQQNGWVLDMFPDFTELNASVDLYGGYAFTLKFHGDSVDVQTEIAADLATTITSLYKLTTDSGATLSFDTYNTLFHYYATPSAYLYHAFGGEFEFLVCDVQKDLIRLKGTRTGKVMYLRALKENPTEYLAKVADMEKLLEKWLVTVGDDNTHVEIRTMMENRRAKIIDLEQNSERLVDLSVSPEGIRFLSPIKIGDETVSEMKPVFADGKFKGMTSENGTMIPWVIPDGYETYENMDFSGTWNLYCKICNAESKVIDTVIPVTFTKYTLGEEKGYEMHGVYPENTIRLNYLEREGKLNFSSHLLKVVEYKYPNMYHAPARPQYNGDKPLIASFYLYGGQMSDRGMMFQKTGEGSYEYVNNKVYPDFDYNCIAVKYFDEYLYDYIYAYGEDWRVKGTEGTPAPYYSFVYEITKLEKAK